MIEWVPINDWESDGSELYIALVETKNPINRVVVVNYPYKYKPGYNLEWSGLKITHAAKINLPVEKTLEEKFEEFRVDVNKGSFHVSDLKGYTYSLAQIAKEHYEGEK